MLWQHKTKWSLAFIGAAAAHVGMSSETRMMTVARAAGSPQGASCRCEPAVAQLADAVPPAVAGVAIRAVADRCVRLGRPPGCDGVLYGLQACRAAVLLWQHLHDSTQVCKVKSGSGPKECQTDDVVLTVHTGIKSDDVC